MNTSTVAEIPLEIQTSCSPLNEAWSRTAPALFSDPAKFTVADTDAALNWEAFLGHSVPARADSGAPSSILASPDFAPLHELGLKLSDLAALWQIEPLREHFMKKGHEADNAPAAASCDTLLASGGPAGKMLCEVFQSHPQSTNHWSVRALLQNASLLTDTNDSFREWLQRESSTLGETEFPPRDFRRMVVTTRPTGGLGQVTLEAALVEIMGRTFHRVNSVVAAHMLSDWQLGLWMNGKTGTFDLFPYDTPYLKFLANCAGSSGAPPEGELAFVRWWHQQPGCEFLPPRLASLVIERQS